eukprot:COSAG02_NODE_4410_length_5388_cov_2.471167_7_plen_226_part_00
MADASSTSTCTGVGWRRIVLVWGMSPTQALSGGPRTTTHGLCQQDDSLTRIEVLRLAFAVTLGVMEVRGTILEHAPDFSSPADLIRKVGRARPEVALRHYTATERAYAETKQNEWSRSVAQLRGEDYIPERSDDESEDSEPKEWDPEWEEAKQAQIEATQAARRHKEDLKRRRIMRKYQDRLAKVPDGAWVVYTDGGYDLGLIPFSPRYYETPDRHVRGAGLAVY